jgi:hypothetical protein
MRLGLGLGFIRKSYCDKPASPAIFTVTAADGTKFFGIRATEDTVIEVDSGDCWVGTSSNPDTTSVNLYADVYNSIYFKGTGTLRIADKSIVDRLRMSNVGSTIGVDITGMSLTTLSLQAVDAVTGTITDMPLTSIFLYIVSSSITGSITDMPLTYLYLWASGANVAGNITESMSLSEVYLMQNTGNIEYDTMKSPFASVMGYYGIWLSAIMLEGNVYETVFEHAAVPTSWAGNSKGLYIKTSEGIPAFSKIADYYADILSKTIVKVPAAWLNAANTIRLLEAIKDYSGDFPVNRLTIETYGNDPKIEDIIDDKPGDAHAIHDLIYQCLERDDLETIVLNTTEFP